MLAFALCASACGLAPLPREAGSFGFPNDGVLLAGQPLPQSGPGFSRAKAGDDTRWGVPLLVSSLARAAAAVELAHPGTAPLMIGDLSARHGGDHNRHGSHRTGRDADVLFYLSDAQGRSVRGSGFYAFDERGVGIVHHPAAPVQGLAFFDTPRNWAFVRALLLDTGAPVQWIFCADGIKARLLRYAAELEQDPELLVRASYVLHQPSRGNPHRDHFHIRMACTAEDRARGCMDPGPVWPWWRNEHEKAAWDVRSANDDQTLLRALLEELEP